VGAVKLSRWVSIVVEDVLRRIRGD